MKLIQKQILTAFFMGVVIPGIALGLLVHSGREKPDRELDETTVATVQTTVDISSQVLSLQIPVLMPDGAVEDMELEEYLCGVVLAEIPVDFELEAQKAQAVVARTYALKRYESGTKHSDGSVCTDPACCQGYLSQEEYLDRGGSQEGIERIKRAVASTSGQVLTYEGDLIDATYFSCSGGTTEDALAVWGSDVPYLQSTDSPGEENATHYTDTVTFTPDEVSVALGVTLAGDPEEWFVDVQYTKGGGVAEISVCGTVYTGVQMRKLLNLRSTDFSISADLEEITIVTHGFGHRVGMSQYGADAMAVRGSTYDEILAHYYQSTVLEQYQES